VRAAYNRAEYLPERRKMLQQRADYLDKISSFLTRKLSMLAQRQIDRESRIPIAYTQSRGLRKSVYSFSSALPGSGCQS
jgi:hypothetical protein